MQLADHIGSFFNKQTNFTLNELGFTSSLPKVLRL